jgi:hypothetical protein
LLFTNDINLLAVKPKLNRILMNMDLAPLYVVRGRTMLIQWGMTFIKLVNRRLAYNLVLKPSYLFLVVDHVC